MRTHVVLAYLYPDLTPMRDYYPQGETFVWAGPGPAPTQQALLDAEPAAEAAFAAVQAEATAYQADRTDLKAQYAAAVTRLEQIRNATSMTNAQSLAALKDLAGVQLRMLKYIRGL